MPVVVDPDPDAVDLLLESMAPGSHAVESVERLQAWLQAHTDEYIVVLGPTLTPEESLRVCESLRTTRPMISVVVACATLAPELMSAAMRAGARDVVTTHDQAALTGAIDRAHQLYLALRGPAGGVHVSKVISVFSPKGGVGKTTVAVNLALALNDRGARRVCLVDLDLAFGDVSITMQLFPSHSIEHAVGSEGTLDVEMLDGLLTRHQDSLMVLAAPSHPDSRERVTPQLVARVLHTLRETFDFVVIDTAPGFDEQVLTALDETDEIVLVATLDVPTLKNVKVALETMDLLHIAMHRRHLLLNRADDAVGINADKVEGILAMPVAVEVSTSLDVAAATNAGRPIMLSDPDHQMSAAIRALATELAGEPLTAPGAAHPAAGGPPAAGRRGRRLLRRK